MDNLIIVLIILIVALCFIVLAVFLKKVALVKENSVKYQKLVKLNQSFEFIKNVKKTIEVTNFVTKKEEISKIDIDLVMKNLFFDNTNNTLVNFESVLRNETEYEKYLKKYNAINDKTGPDFIKLTNLSDNNFTFLENRLFKMHKLSPLVKTKVKLTIKFDGLKGESEYKKDKTYRYEDLKNLYNEKENNK